MNKIIEYQVATADGDVKELIDFVNHLIKDGFQPLGGISVATSAEVPRYAQAMVKEYRPEKREQVKPVMLA